MRWGVGVAHGIRQSSGEAVTKKGTTASTDTNYRTARSKSAHCEGLLGPNPPLDSFWWPPSSRPLGKEGVLQPPAGKCGEARPALSIVTKWFC